MAVAPSGGYDVSAWLQDRAWIQDQASLLYLNYDNGDIDELNNIFADEVYLDYTDLYGGEPYTVTRDQLISDWRAVYVTLADCQHTVTSIVPQLPEPSEDQEPPTNGTAWTNIASWLRSKCNNVVDNRNRATYRMTKISDSTTSNPWRISGLIPRTFWQSAVPFTILADDYGRYQNDTC